MTSERQKEGQENVMVRRINEQIYGEGKRSLFLLRSNYLNVFSPITKAQKIMVATTHSISQQLQGFRINIWASIP